MIENLGIELGKLDFIEEVYLDTIEYPTESGTAPASFVGNDRDYKKLSIKDTAKGLAWFYKTGSEVTDGNETADYELYIMVNASRAKLSKQAIEDKLKSVLSGSGRSYSLEMDARRALSRYDNFFETLKQIGKIPYLVFRFEFSDNFTQCLRYD